MSQIRRFVFAMKVTFAMSIPSIIHFRVGVEHLYPLAQDTFSGPFSHVADSLEFVVPITIAVIVIAAWGWVFYSPVQEERTVRRAPRR